MRVALVYIAGPFTAPDVWSVTENIHRAERLARQVVEIGALPVCPHSMGRSFVSVGDPQLWYAGTLELMRRCDAAVFTSDWERSDGATKEMRCARQLGRMVHVEHVSGCHVTNLRADLVRMAFDLLPPRNATSERANGFRDLLGDR